MCAKALTNLLKLSMVLSGARSGFEKLDFGLAVDFDVTKDDVEASWDLVKQSINVYKAFKASNTVDMQSFKLHSQVKLAQDLGEVLETTSIEDLIVSRAEKMAKLYSLVDENNEVKISVVEKFCAYPRSCSLEDFVSVGFEQFVACCQLLILFAGPCGSWCSH